MLPLAAYVAYVLSGSMVRLAFLYEVRPAVRLGALARRRGDCRAGPGAARVSAVARPAVEPARRRRARAARSRSGRRCSSGNGPRVAPIANVEASRALGRLLPAGTLVHGKLANGLALDNRIRPVFVGREFGNYADRRERDDIPCLLTYVAPEVGYEGSVILDVLEAYPAWRVLRTFPVAESPGGQDLAALVDKGPPSGRRCLTAATGVAPPAAAARPPP